MKGIFRIVVAALAVVVLLAGAVSSVRWARRGGAAARLVASAMILGLGMGVVTQPPQQGVEQAETEAEKLNGESGDPPS